MNHSSKVLAMLRNGPIPITMVIRQLESELASEQQSWARKAAPMLGLSPFGNPWRIVRSVAPSRLKVVDVWFDLEKTLLDLNRRGCITICHSGEVYPTTTRQLDRRQINLVTLQLLATERQPR